MGRTSHTPSPPRPRPFPLATERLPTWTTTTVGGCYHLPPLRFGSGGVRTPARTHSKVASSRRSSGLWFPPPSPVRKGRWRELYSQSCFFVGWVDMRAVGQLVAHIGDSGTGKSQKSCRVSNELVGLARIQHYIQFVWRAREGERRALHRPHRGD
eukprot:scaffold212291_cov29-Tisochrysis_lutea.AAC.3